MALHALPGDKAIVYYNRPPPGGNHNSSIEPDARMDDIVQNFREAADSGLDTVGI